MKKLLNWVLHEGKIEVPVLGVYIIAQGAYVLKDGGWPIGS